MDIKKFLDSWNGILFVLFIGIFLMFPALKSVFGGYDAEHAPEVNQVQLFVGGLAVIWGLRGVWQKLSQKKE